MKKSTFILSALLILVILAAAIGARFLLLKINDQRGEIEDLQSAQTEMTAQADDSNSQISQLNTQLSSLQTQLQAAQDNVSQLNDGLTQATEKSDGLQNENDQLNGQLSSLTDYLAQSGGIADVNDDSRASSVFIPKEVIALLDTFVKAISTGDEALYLSTVKGGAELPADDPLMSPFDGLKGTAYTITKIDDGGYTDVVTLQTGAYFLALTASDGAGNAVGIPSGGLRVGVTFDTDAGQWLIYDFD